MRQCRAAGETLRQSRSAPSITHIFSDLLGVPTVVSTSKKMTLFFSGAIELTQCTLLMFGNRGASTGQRSRRTMSPSDLIRPLLYRTAESRLLQTDLLVIFRVQLRCCGRQSPEQTASIVIDTRGKK
jgi:hypothetical protein